MVSNSKIFFILFLLLAPSGSLLAQTRREPARPVYLAINSGISIADNSFTDTWQPSPSLQFNSRFPFYRGQLEGGVRYTKFDGAFAHSNFQSIFIHLGYSFPIHVSNFYQIAPSVRFGDHLMLFDQPEVYTKGPFRYTTDPTESEFAYELALRNQFQLSRHVYINLTASYNRTLTNFPLPLGQISAGISYSFAEPHWLKDFLQ